MAAANHTSELPLSEQLAGTLSLYRALVEMVSAEARIAKAKEADLGERFDCALANLYAAGGEAACAWHRDPEHGDDIDGAKWARPTFVVSAGVRGRRRSNSG